MAEPTVVSEPADPRLADFVSLTDVALRRRKEPAEGMFVAEGEKVIRRAVAAGFPVRSLLLEARWLPALADVVAGAGCPVYVADPALLEVVTGYAVHRGALAAMDRLPLPSAAEVIDAARRLVVLEDVNDHTNVGLIFRCAAALGMDGVLLTPRTADPLYRRAVKTSMGAVFSVPWTRLAAWPGDLGLLRESGFRTMAMSLDPLAVDLADISVRSEDRLAVLLGSEGSGLRPHTAVLADRLVRIPMAHGVDSLNVASAAAIVCYVLAGT